jgi:hypothetical protein
MMEFLFLLHRYLGIALGLVVSLWCLSGFVMIYVQFPDITSEEQLQGLNDLDLANCCVLPDDFSDISVYRIHYEDGKRLYLNGVSGQLSFAADSDRQWSRWLLLGLHRGDLSGLIRSRPLWDLMLLPLLAGVTLGALTGTWMGFKRLLS